MNEANGGRGRNRRIRKKGRPGKRARAQPSRARRKPVRRRRRRSLLLKAIAHPVRRLMLHEIGGSAGLTPAQLAKTFDLPPVVTTYHATVLQRCGAVEAAPPEDG